MNEEKLRDLLIKVKSGEETLEAAVASLKDLPFTDLGFAMVDNHRQLRNGYPEVIYCEGKTPEQVATIMSHISQKGTNVLGTRATQAMYDIIKEILPNVIYNPMGRTIQLISEPLKETETYIAIVCAGTSDLPVVEEAYETARLLGNKVIKVTDVGVAGIHRLLSKMDVIRNARVVIVVAGMEGALASVVGGLVDKPVIAVPTSVGYGASFGGVSALLTMLNSCASGVSVVNIDNGFGAAYSASMINQLK